MYQGPTYFFKVCVCYYQFFFLRQWESLTYIKWIGIEKEAFGLQT